MPLFNADNAQILGDDEAFSIERVGECFGDAQYLPKFKNSISSQSFLKKQGMRAFQKSASFVESARAVVTATTNYPKIWRDILSLKDKVRRPPALSSGWV